MAKIGAVNDVGESIVALLRSRRDLLESAGQLTPVNASLDITQLSVSALSGGTTPTSGLSLTCYQINHSDQPKNQHRLPGEPVRPEIAVELQYILASWSSRTEDEHAAIAWAMLELNSHSVLDRSTLRGADIWEPEETVQIVPSNLSADEQYRLWDATGQKFRLSLTFTARVIRLRHGLGDEFAPVVASRFGFSDSDPLQREPA